VSPNPEASGTPTPKRKRGRPRKNPLPDHTTPTTGNPKVLIHTVKSDAAALGQLLNKLNSQSSQPSKPSAKKDAKKAKSPGKSPVANQVEQTDDDIVLSLLSEKYRNIMWSNFKKLGRKQEGGKREGEASKHILDTLKNGLGKNGRLLKKSGGAVIKVDDEAARQKIYQDLKRRMESSHNWLEDASEISSSAEDTPLVEDRPRLTPTRIKHRASSVTAEKPRSSPSRSPRRGPQKINSPAVRGKHAVSKRPLAPIFLKRYERKQPRHMAS
jgi:hypothetical protein